MITKIYCCFAFCLFIFLSVGAQQNISIKGKVTDDKSNPVEYATVHLLNTNFVSLTDAKGVFSIVNINEGTYTIEVSSIGYASFINTIVVQKNSANNFDIHLAYATQQLDQVVVSAQKREENLQTVPVSITSLSAKEVDDYRLWSSKDLAGISPNLNTGNPGDGRNVISVRGITSSSYDPAVVTYIDGVSQFTLDTYIPQLFDVEHIEILKGPQGTLYGRNALGGVINIITKKPTDKLEADAELSTGNYGMQRYTASVKLPLIKGKLFFGAALLYEGMNGFYTNDFDNSHFDQQHRFGGNYYLKYLINSKWMATLNVKHLANRNNGTFPLAGSDSLAFANPFHVNQNAVGEMVDNTWNASLSLQYSGNAFNFSSQTSYQSNYRYYKSPLDGDFSPIDGVSIINDYGSKWNTVKVATQEFKFTSPAASASPLKWTTGAYLFYQDAPTKQGTHFGKDAMLVGSPDTDYTIIGTTKIKNYGASVYGQVNYAITKKINILAGIRYDYQHSQEEVLGEYLPDGATSPAFQTQPDTLGKASYSAFSPMVSIGDQLSQNTNLYASYNRGYRTGGLTQLSSDPSQPPLYAYKPEYSNNFEVGLKNTFFDKKMTANIAAFYTVVNDAQVPTLILPDAITITKNAGKLTSKGFDLDVSAILVKDLEADYAFGYTKSTYNTLNLSSNGNAENLSGNHQIFTPDFTSMLAVQYNLPLNQKQTTKIFIRGEWFIIGKEYFDLANTITQSSYQLLNARVGISFPHVTISLWARNITDKKYIAYAYDFGAVHLGDPKTYGVTAKFNLTK